MGLFIGLATLFGIMVFIATRSSARISMAAFRKIENGMTRSELHELLGPTRYEAIHLGRLTGPTTMVVNLAPQNRPELLKQGYDDYIMESWTSPEVTITVFIDANDKVVCRYTSGGQKMNPIQSAILMMWPRPRNLRLKTSRVGQN